MKCRNCGKPIDKPLISIRNRVLVYKHTNGNYFCKDEGLSEYSHAEPKEKE